MAARCNRLTSVNMLVISGTSALVRGVAQGARSSSGATTPAAIEDIATEMKRLPNGRTPTARDWEKISGKFLTVLDDRIAALERTRKNLTGCIGCGCLSLDKCALYNPQDKLSREGAGPRNTIAKSDKST